MNQKASRRIDSHCHLWDLSRGDYGWLDPENPDLQAIARNFNFSDLEQADGPESAEQYVVVQAAPTTEETDYLLQLSQQHQQIGAVVGWVDLSSKAVGVQLAQFSKHSKFKGVRPMLQDIEDVDWINQVARRSAIEALVANHLRFDALVLPQHLEALLSFSLSHPSLPVVIDHAAKPALAADKNDARHEMWRVGMALLAKETSACCKISGLLTELSPQQRTQPAKTLQPVIDDLLNWFGPDRLMWGSDWPVLNLAAPYRNWHSLSGQLLSELNSTDLERVYAGTAQEFYAIAGDGV